jgi:hypothetical protein
LYEEVVVRRNVTAERRCLLQGRNNFRHALPVVV